MDHNGDHAWLVKTQGVPTTESSRVRHTESFQCPTSQPPAAAGVLGGSRPWEPRRLQWIKAAKSYTVLIYSLEVQRDLHKRKGQGM